MRQLLYFVPLLAGTLLSPCVSQEAEECGDPVVQTPLGAVRGTIMESRSRKKVYAFRGLRYSKPPVGRLRFKAPVPIREKWDGIVNATSNAPSCPQPASTLKGPISEDCLFLNVYTKKLPRKGRNPRLPVLVWIHHGAWFLLSSQSDFLGPEYLLDEDMVLVMFNFRLGALGLLSTGDSEVPGNNALKDQLLALKWVRDNIASFGGNPDLVTIYGYSAGAASVQFHMASPRSAGLFHRAISGSGSALCPWALARNPMRETRRLVELVNCPHSSSATSKQIVDCLRRKDADEIAKTYYQLREWNSDPLIIFAPVIEAKGGPDEPFLTEDPELLFQTGRFTQVPWMTGTTSNEMMGFASAIVQNKTLLKDFSEDFERIAPIAFYYEREGTSSLAKSRKLKTFYFPDGRITQDSLQPITDLYTDGIFLHDADRAVKLISTTSRSPVYYYHFVYRGRFGNLPVEPGMDRPRGPIHHDDLLYLFWDHEFPFFEDYSPEAVVSKRLVSMWANFARTGNPTAGIPRNNEDLVTTKWIPHTPNGLSYMEIGGELVMKRALRQERAAVWEYIYPQTTVVKNLFPIF